MAGENWRPSGATGIGSHGKFLNDTKVGKELIFDRPIVNIWNGCAGSNYSTTDTWWSLEPAGGHPVGTEVNSSGIMAMKCDANSEGLGVLWRIPEDCDVNKAIDFRICWVDVTDAAAAGTATWTIVYTALTAGTTAIAVGATALGTVITATTNVAVNVPVWTEWGTIAAATTAIAALIPGDDLLQLKCTVALSSVTDADPLLVQARYYRKYLGATRHFTH